MNRNILVRIATPVPARLWSGTGDLYLPADAIETTDAALYLGGGALIGGIDDIEQLINGTADRLEAVVSGVNRATVALAIKEAGEVKGAAVDIGTVEFDPLWQVDRVVWAARYRADKLTTERQPGQRLIKLSMGSDDTGRSRSPGAYWTAADQRRLYPDDAFFDFVSGLNAGTSRSFGPNG